MAIAFGRARYISRSTGGNSVRTAAYNGRMTLFDVRTNRWFHFGHRDEPEYHNILLPQDAPANWAESRILWNEVEQREDRVNSQVAREIVLGLPNEIEDLDLDDEEKLEHLREMVESFAHRHFVSQGLAVQIDIHEPHDAQLGTDEANWHAHLLITTRRLGRDGFAATKARDLDPTIRRIGGRGQVIEGDLWGALWGEHQEEYFRAHEDLEDIEVDPPAIVPQPHLGMRRTWDDDGDAVATIAANHAENFEAAHNPARVIAALTRRNATFTERDLDRCLEHNLTRHGADANTVADVRRRVMALGRGLFERATGEFSGRYTTVGVRADERRAGAEAGRLIAADDARPLDAAHVQEAIDERTLRADEIEAVRAAAGSARLTLVGARGRTGANSALSAICDAHRLGGYRVVGLGANAASAGTMAEEGFLDPRGDPLELHVEAPRTVGDALAAVTRGEEAWDRWTLLVVDGSGRLEAGELRGLLERANGTGAKVLLLGDAPTGIARGGPGAGGGVTAELARRYGSIRIERADGEEEDALDDATRDRRSASLRWATAEDMLQAPPPPAPPGGGAPPGDRRSTRGATARRREEEQARPLEEEITANRGQFRERYAVRQARETLRDFASLLAARRAARTRQEHAAVREEMIELLRTLRNRADVVRLAGANAGGALTDEERQGLARLLREPDPVRAADAIIAGDPPAAGPSRSAGAENRPTAQEIAAGRANVRESRSVHQAREELRVWDGLMARYDAARTRQANGDVRDEMAGFLRRLRSHANVTRLADPNAGGALTAGERGRLARLLREPDPIRAVDELIAEQTGVPPPPRAAAADVEMEDAGEGPSNARKRPREQDSGDEGEGRPGPSSRRRGPRGRGE